MTQSLARVTEVSLTSGSGGYMRAEIIVRRGIDHGGTFYPAPNPEDIPEDIRDALRVWLAGNQP